VCVSARETTGHISSFFLMQGHESCSMCIRVEFVQEQNRFSLDVGVRKRICLQDSGYGVNSPNTEGDYYPADFQVGKSRFTQRSCIHT